MPYTMQSYIDEVTMRLNRYQVSLELDEGALEVIINDARRFVHSITVQLFPERYGEILTLDQIVGNTATRVTDFDTNILRRNPNGTITTVTNTVWIMALPANFVDPEAVIINGTFGWREARRTVKKELYSALRNTNSCPYPHLPVYCIEKATNSSGYVIYVSKGSEAVTVGQVEVWYSRALKYLQMVDPNTGLPDVELVMSYEFEELVVLDAMLKSLQKTNFQSAELSNLVAGEMEQVIGAVEEKYNTAIDRGSLLLPSKEGLYPGQPVMRSPNNGLLSPQQQGG